MHTARRTSSERRQRPSQHLASRAGCFVFTCDRVFALCITRLYIDRGPEIGFFLFAEPVSAYFFSYFSMGCGHHYLYIVRCADGSLFTGTSGDVERTVREMNSGIGNPYVRTRAPVFLAYSEEYMNELDAERRATIIKRMNREGKERLLSFSGLSGFEYGLAT